jgi:hypothetical protein
LAPNCSMHQSLRCTGDNMPRRSASIELNAHIRISATLEVARSAGRRCCAPLLLVPLCILLVSCSAPVAGKDCLCLRSLAEFIRSVRMATDLMDEPVVWPEGLNGRYSLEDRKGFLRGYSQGFRVALLKGNMSFTLAEDSPAFEEGWAAGQLRAFVRLVEVYDTLCCAQHVAGSVPSELAR